MLLCSISDPENVPKARLISHAQAYKRAALKYHPDKVPSEERCEAEKKFKQARLIPDMVSITCTALIQ